MVIHRESLPLKDLAISAKSGGGIHFGVMGLSSGVFADWLEMVEVLTVGATVSLGHPILWVTGKGP